MFVDRKFNVQGMFCSACKEKIESKVKKIPGVLDVTVNQSTNEMVVRYSKAFDNVKQTLDVVKELGYGIGLKSKEGKLQVVDFNVNIQEIMNDLYFHYR